MASGTSSEFTIDSVYADLRNLRRGESALLEGEPLRLSREQFLAARAQFLTEEIPRLLVPLQRAADPERFETVGEPYDNRNYSLKQLSV